MNLRSFLSLGVILLCLPLQIFGQKSTISNAQLVKTYTFYKNTDPGLSHLNYFDAMAEKMHLSAQSKMVLTEEVAGKNGYTHFKYQQFQEGLPIFGSRYFLHEKDGNVKTATGHYTPQTTTTNKPAINAATATAFAKKAMKAREYDKRTPEPILCFIDPAFPKVSETILLAYQVDLHSTEPFDKHRYFVDAASGKIINHFPLILHEGVPSTAKTRYYGVQNIITDSIAPQQFVLRDLTRGEGILVTNNDGSSFTNTSSTWDLTSQNDDIALDAHYCTQEYYDMMLADYNWQGQDGHGKALQAVVHGGAYVNAFWDGESTTYGDGDCNYGPLTTLEVVGHEFTHGMVDYTSKLVYGSESGAMNESLADMFGKMLERKTDPANFSWDLGHSFLLTPSAKPFRVMDDPISVEMPAFYKGMFWLDNNDVHYNSSIGNLWFSMLVDGKQGINEIGQAFNVPALGVDKTGQIVFETNKNYLTENSDYNAFYQYSVDVAEMLYGAGSQEALAVTEAWKAVGLPNTPPATFDLRISSGDGFSANNYCGLGQFLPVKFTVTNVSSIAYDPAMMASVTFSNAFLSNYTYNLTSPIGPGEVFDIEIDNWLVATQLGFTYVDANLNINDADVNNNYFSAYYNIAEFEANDLGLFVSSDVPDCFATVKDLFLFVVSNSCEAIPSGTVLNFTATDDLGNLAWSSPYNLTEDLAGFGSLFIPAQIPSSFSNLNFKLEYSNDPNLTNNEYYDFSQQASLTITGNYLNNFEINQGQDNYLQLLYNSIEPTMLYQSNHYFASSGQASDPNEFQHCADPFSAFDYEFGGGINASAHTCIDFSFSAAPTLEFDMVQFRNIFTDTSNYEYSSMLQAKWTGNNNGDQIIYDQPEGLIKHHNIALPPFFKGALDLRLYTELGHWGLDPSFLNEDDFVLLDNLKLSAPTVGTNEAALNSPILISPNPARDMAAIQSADGIKSILLQNVSGQTLQTLQVNANRYDLDLKGLSNGFYLLSIQLDNGQWRVRKLVKMD